MTEQLAMRYYAESCRKQGSEILFWDDVSRKEKEAIYKRLDDLLAGRIAKPDMDEVDLAVFQGRPKFLDLEVPPQFAKQKKNDPYEKIRKARWYDCVEFVPREVRPEDRRPPFMPAHCRLFGQPSHLGNPQLCNLQVLGQLGADQSFYVQFWYLSAEVEGGLAGPLERLLANTTVTLVFGDMPQRQSRAIELFRDTEAVGHLLPVRQNFFVNIDFAGRSFEHFCDRVLWRYDAADRDPYRIFVNLEGWQVPSVA